MEMNEKIKNLSQSVTVKIVTIGILILFLLIPVAWIKSLIRERESNRDMAILEINDKWGHSQTITGPILSVPYFEIVTEEKKTYKVRKYAHFLPNDLKVNGTIDPEIRKRGIYRVINYKSSMQVSGEFLKPDFKQLKISPELIIWKDAFLTVGITDMRGIEDNITIKWDNLKVPTNSGIPSKDVIQSGLSASINLDLSQAIHEFSFQLKLRGSKDLFFVPVGKTTVVNLTSDWAHPKFTGSFLPDPRTVTEEGFIATWKILDLNRNYPQQWTNKDYKIQGFNQNVARQLPSQSSDQDSKFGVELLFGVDQYQKSMRSVKYAIMFIALTFLVFFFIELINKKMVHPIQYLLVSIGIILFYSLLTSLSEQMSFTLAYIISATSIISLITIYSHSIFKQMKLTKSIFFILFVLYMFLFTLLQLQDYALLLGNIGLFITLAIVMYVSRKIDWYGNIIKKQDETI